MSLSLNGAFWPTILPLFHGSRCAADAMDSMMDSCPVEGSPTCSCFSTARRRSSVRDGIVLQHLLLGREAWRGRRRCRHTGAVRRSMFSAAKPTLRALSPQPVPPALLGSPLEWQTIHFDGHMHKLLMDAELLLEEVG